MKLSIKNRIALYSVIGIAGISLAVFIAIYFTVKNTVYSEIDTALKFEANKHINEVIHSQDTVYFVYEDEWLEREHIEIEVYPLFVELFNAKGESLDKSPNLQKNSLQINPYQTETFIENKKLNEENVRQIQIQLTENKVNHGFIAIAIPLGDAELVIKTLLDALLVIYPILLLITFFTSRIISRITIKPISRFAKKVDEINSNSLNKRLPETNNGDELETLSKAINDFLNRIDEAVQREKQFTADASHQLRTPLAVIKGNLEVLIRKNRQPELYIEEIKNNIKKIDEMTDAVDKLLMLARLNSQKTKLETEQLIVFNAIEHSLSNYKYEILKKQLRIDIQKNESLFITSNKVYFSLILDNLISNAVKYAFEKSTIQIHLQEINDKVEISITNQGPKIKTDEINAIFNPFYRNKDHENTTRGYGLGLTIVTKAAQLLQIKIEVTSNEQTSFKLIIP
jgi:signal transduction histidine kinase